MLIFFGTVMAVLYHIGVTQFFSVKLGWLMRITTGTTAIESTSVASNIFLSLVRNYHDIQISMDVLF